MAIAFRAADSALASAQSAGVQQLNVPIPASVATGDTMAILVCINDDELDYSLSSTPAGWTQIETDTSGSQQSFVYTRTAQAGDAGGTAAFQISELTGGTGAKVIGDLVAYSGAALDTHAALAQTSTPDHPTPVVSPTAHPAVILVGLGKKSSSLTSITQPTGYTARDITTDFGGGGIATGWADIDLASGSSDGGSWTTDAASAAASTFSIALVESGTPPAGAEILYRSGGAWVAAEVMYRSGGVWVPAEIKRRSAGAWV